MAAEFEITGAGRLQTLAGDLVKVSAQFRPVLRTRLRAAATPIRDAVRDNVRAIPVHGETSTGLRESIAKATKIRASVTAKTIAVRVYVDSKAMPPGQQALPALMEGRGWTHPVFGHTVKAFQPGHSYFKGPADAALPAARAAAVAAVDEATRTIR